MTITLIARLVLAAVFAVASLTKLADRAGTRKAVVAFGAPERIAGALALLVPLAELAVALVLLPSGTAVAGAVGALALLGVFSAAIVWSLAHGRAPDCHCFGQLHSAPTSWKTVARNGVLAALGVVVISVGLAGSTTSATAWIGDLNGSELLALAVAVTAGLLLAVGAMAFLSLLRSYGKVLVRLDRLEAAIVEAGIDIGDLEQEPEIGLAPGTPAPAFDVPSLTGERITLGSLSALDVPSLLLFTSPHCGPCKTLFPIAAAWQEEHADVLNVVFVTDGGVEAARVEAKEFELDTVVLDEDHELYARYEANGTPSAVLIAPDGTIGSWVASGSDWIEQLVSEATSDATTEEEMGLPVGTEAPDVALPSLDGNRVSLTDLRGRDTLLLFWNPDCGFCRSMHDDLVAWEQSRNGQGPQLVVVSSGDEESTRAEGFLSLVLLDEEYAAGGAFGANGTPMAVLVDAKGRIASDVAAGAEAVLTLANGR